MPDGQEQDRLRQAARERGAAVLADLMTRAGVSLPAELARRSQLADAMISDQTVTNLLTAKGAARDRSVLRFIRACLQDQRHNPRLAGHQATEEFWKARYDDALGRAGDPTAGLVRVGLPPPAPVVFVDRPDVGKLAAAVEVGESVVLTPSDEQQPFQNPGRIAEERSRVLSGMGGVGKSQLAAQYAWQVWQDPSLDLAIWVSGRTTDAIVSAYAQAAARLLGANNTQPEQAAQQLMTWMSTTTRTWLIVLDDVQLANQVQPWWPEPTESGQVIVTTRYRGDGLYRPGRQIIEVGLYSPHQARDYLQRRLVDAPHLSYEPDAQHPSEELLDGLAADLGRLPLALTHAAAYLLQEDMPIAEYRALFADYENRLASLFPHRDELPDAGLATVATTWQISMDLAARLAPGGVVPVVMLLASLLDPDGIPRGVFTSEAVTNVLASVLGRSVQERELWSVVQVLHRLSLVTLDGRTPDRAVRVHGLVQRATRDEADQAPTGLAAMARVAAEAVLGIWPKVERDTDLAAALRSNTKTLLAVAEAAMWNPSGHPVLFRAGFSIGNAGLVSDAVTYFHQLSTTAHTYLGPDHPDTLTTRHELAVWRGEAGDPVGAAAATAELLNDRLRMLGPDHPHTLTARANVAFWRSEAGDLTGAATAYTELLDDLVRVLGPDHPNTLANRQNFALLRGKAGDPVGAAAAYAELLDDQVRVLGPDHPHTLLTRHNLAAWRGEAGDPVGAAAATAELLDDHVRVLGPDHPHTLLTRHSLARWRGEAGDPVGAAAATAELLDEHVRVLGPDHPHILDARGSVAHWRGEAGDPAGAATAYAELLDDQVRVLGPDHPNTFATRHSVAFWRGEAGDPAGAATAYAELLDDQVRVLGPDHPNTLAARYNLAFWQGRAGDPVGAATAFAELLDDLIRVLGPDHPHIKSAEEAKVYWQQRATESAT